MYTPDDKDMNRSDNETEPTTPTNTENTDVQKPSPAVDPSYNPYLQEKKPPEPEPDTQNPVDPTDNTQASRAADSARTSSWEAGTGETGGKKCPYCGTVLRDGAKFCVSCGRPLQSQQTPPNGYPYPGSGQRDNPPRNPYGAPVPPPGGSAPQYTNYTPIGPTVPEKLSVLDYFVMLFVSNIPVVGLILALFWGFSSSSGVNRKNFARTVLIMRAIQYVLALFYILIFVILSGNSGGFNGSSLFY